MRPITASDLMNPTVLTVSEDLPVRELAGFLVDNEITGAPVVDAEGHLVGVVSLVDIAEAKASGDFDDDEDVVADIMHPGLFTVNADASVPEIARLLLEKHIHRLLVLRDDKAVGILTTSDLLGLLLEE